MPRRGTQYTVVKPIARINEACSSYNLSTSTYPPANVYEKPLSSNDYFYYQCAGTGNGAIGRVVMEFDLAEIPEINTDVYTVEMIQL